MTDPSDFDYEYVDRQMARRVTTNQHVLCRNFRELWPLRNNSEQLGAMSLKVIRRTLHRLVRLIRQESR